jgi:biotin operon repressor
MIDLLSTTPQTKKVLAEKLRTTPREVELMVQAARAEGVAIVSGAQGYWLAATPEEAKAWEDAQRRRILAMFRSLRGVRRGRLAMLGEQGELWA